MSARRRALRVLARGASGACILIVCALLLSKFWSIVWAWKARNLACELDCGLLRIYWGGSIVPGQPTFFFAPRGGTWTGWVIAAISSGFLPEHRSNSGWHALDVPLVSLLALTTVALLILRWLARRRPAPGTCPCGYDLTGNTSGRCPECGLARDDAAIAKSPA